VKKEGTSKTVLKIFSLFWRSSCRSTLLCSRKFCSNRRCQLCSKDETRAQNAAPDETRQALNFEKFDMEERHKEGPLSQFGGGKNVRFESQGTRKLETRDSRDFLFYVLCDYSPRKVVQCLLSLRKALK